MDDGFSETELLAWRAFIGANLQLFERLDHELQQRSGLSLTDFEILQGLSQAADRQLRMNELADQVFVSRSRLTYRIDRLSELGYVDRAECEDDRRGLFALLTDAGEQALAAALPGHTTDLRTWFFDAMDDHEVEVMARVMRRMEEKLAQA